MSLLSSWKNNPRTLKRLFSSTKNSKPANSAEGFGSRFDTDTERELALVEIAKDSNTTGRCLRVFCDKVHKDLFFKNVFVTNTTTADACVQELINTLDSDSKLPKNAQYALAEVRGKIVSSSNINHQSDSIQQALHMDFIEESSRLLLPSEKVMDLFSCTGTAVGQARRLELRLLDHVPRQDSGGVHARKPKVILRKQPSSDINCDPVPTNLSNEYCNQPHLHLIKGNWPERDRATHILSDLFSREKSKMTIGLSSSSDIRLFLPPGSSRKKSSVNVPASLILQSKGNAAPELCIEFLTDYRADEPSILLNKNRLFSAAKPSHACIQPGDVLSFEDCELSYVFVFKDPTRIPEHKLILSLLSQPQMPAGKIELPVTPAGSRSASRTARISAIRRLSVTSIDIDDNLFLPSDIPLVVASLFPQNLSLMELELQSFIDVSAWMRKGASLPDVSISAACFAHFARSLVFAQYSRSPTALPKRNNCRQEIHATLEEAIRMELSRFSIATEKYLMPAVWKVAFCLYVSSYLTPNWIRQPRWQPGDGQRANDALADTDTGSNDTSESNSWIIRNNFENLPELHVLREIAADEADRTLDKAVEQALAVLKETIRRVCATIGMLSKTAKYKTELGAFDRQMNNILTCLKEVLSFSAPENPLLNADGKNNIDYPVCLTQAEIYSDNINVNTPSNTSDLDSTEESPSNSEVPARLVPAVDLVEGSGRGPNLASAKIQEVFFQRLLRGLSALIIEEFLNPKLSIDTDSGDQLLLFVDHLIQWMKWRAGLDNWNDSSNMLSEYAKLMAMSREELLQTRWRILHRRFPHVPIPILNNLLESYENGQAIRQANGWLDDRPDVTTYDESLPFVEFSSQPKLSSGTSTENQIKIDSDIKLKRDQVRKDTVHRVTPTSDVTKNCSIPKDHARLTNRTRFHILSQSDSEKELKAEETLVCYTRDWKRQERLTKRELVQSCCRAKPKHTPIDFVTIFQQEKTKITVQGFDDALAAKNINFRWESLLKRFPPPPCISPWEEKANGQPVQIRGATGRFARSKNSLLTRNGSSRRESSTSNDNFERTAPSYLGSKQGLTMDTPYVPSKGLPPPPPLYSNSRPKLSSTSGCVNGRNSTTNNCRSELCGPTSRHLTPLGGDFRLPNRLVPPNDQRLIDLGHSSPFLNEVGCSKKANTVNQRKVAGSLLGLPINRRYNSTQQINKSSDNDIRFVRDSWRKFRQESRSRPFSPSTLEPSPSNEYSSRSVSCDPINRRLISDSDLLALNASVDLPDGRITYQNSQSRASRKNLSLNLYKSPMMSKSASQLGISGMGRRQASNYSLLGVDMKLRTPDNVIANIQLSKCEEETFGINLVEGHKTSLDQPGIFVTNVAPNSPALNSQQLELGDRIIAINGKDLTGLTFKDSMALLKSCKHRIILTVQKGSIDNPEALLQLNSREE